MPVPQFLLDLLQLLFDLAVPAAFCTLAAAGVSLRQEGGINFHINGRRANGFCGRLFFLQSHSFSHGLQRRAFMFLQPADRLEQAGSPVWKRSSRTS